jgi:hypothetical protein
VSSLCCVYRGRFLRGRKECKGRGEGEGGREGGGGEGKEGRKEEWEGRKKGKNEKEGMGKKEQKVFCSRAAAVYNCALEEERVAKHTKYWRGTYLPVIRHGGDDVSLELATQKWAALLSDNEDLGIVSVGGDVCVHAKYDLSDCVRA